MSAYRSGYEADAPPEESEVKGITVFSLIPINIDRSYGLTVFYLASNPDFALKNFDHVVFPSRQEAEARLIQSHRSPSGTSRVHPYGIIQYQSQVSLRLLYAQARVDYDIALLKANPFAALPNPPRQRYSKPVSSEDALQILTNNPTLFHNHYFEELSSCFFITDIPIINSAALFSETSLGAFSDGLPCYSQSIAKALAQKPLIDSEITKGMFGLPTIKRVRFNKNGQPRRKPGITIAAKKAAYLKDRCTDIDARPHFEALREIEDLVSDIPHGFSSPYEHSRSPSHLISCNFGRHEFLDTIFPPPPNHEHSYNSNWQKLNPFGNFYHRHLGGTPPVKNWDSEPHYHAGTFQLFIEPYTRLLRTPEETYNENPTHCQYGILRCPAIYLYRRHSSKVLSLLAPLLPDLLRFKNYPLTGYPGKTDRSLDISRANTYNTYRRLIFLLARSMIQGPFQAAYRVRSFQFPTVTPPQALNVETPSEDTTSPASPEEAVSESIS